MTKLSKTTLLAVLSFTALTSFAQEAAIRKSFGEHLPNFAPINEVSKSEVPGIYEVRINGSEIVYTDAGGNYLLMGKMIDVKSKRSLTDEHLERLNTVKFKDLPVADSITIVRGNGARKVAIFEDPNCGYCKKLERDLQKLENVTIHVFLYPILGPDSMEKSKGIWCAQDKSLAWQDWMVRNQAAQPAGPECETISIHRNIEFGKRNNIKGTPTIYFANDKRIPGSVDLKTLEANLGDAKSKEIALQSSTPSK